MKIINSNHFFALLSNFRARIKFVRFFQAAESGNLEDFSRLYLDDRTRLTVRDCKGRAPAHQAAARNRVTILQFIRNHGGGNGRRFPFTSCFFEAINWIF